MMNMYVPVLNGFFGRTRRATQFTVLFQKQNYSFSEPVKMMIDCNNSASNHDIKQIKFKLFLEFRQYHQHQTIHESAMCVFEKKWNKDKLGVRRKERKTINLAVAIPNVLPFCPNDVCPRWEVKEFFDEQDRLIAIMMPPSYKSRSFEIFYFAKIKVVHDSMFTDPCYSEPVMLRFEQSNDRQVFLKEADDEFDQIDFDQPAQFIPKKSLTMQQMILRD